MTITAYRAAVLADSPAGFWQLQSVATAGVDSSGNARHGTVSGTIYTPAEAGPGVDVDAVKFDYSTPGRIIVPDNNVWSSTNFTVEAWVRAGRLTGNVQTMIRKSHSTLGQAEWLLSEGGVHRLRFRISNTAVATWRGTFTGDINEATCPRDAWHHVAAVFNGTQCRAFIDGVLVESPGTGPTGTRVGNTTGNLIIGAAHDTGTEPWDGGLSMVAYYPSALSDARIASHYAAMTLTPPCVQRGYRGIGLVRGHGRF